MALVCEHHKDGVKETEECERREERDKALVEELFTCKIPHGIASYNTSQQWNAEILVDKDIRHVIGTIDTWECELTMRTEIATFPYET